MDVYERLDDISADTAEARAANILHGLGFSKAMQNQKTKDFSGNVFIFLNVLEPFTYLYVLIIRWLENENCFSSSIVCQTAFVIT